jgi:hypothetical protein
MKTILSLFDYTGAWSLPYREAGYNVIQIDIKHGDDIMQLGRSWVKMQGPIHGILCAHPCDEFAGSGARWWKEKDSNGTTAKAVRMANHTLDLIEWAEPKWWVWENPVGRLNRMVPRLRPHGPNHTFNPNEYGGWTNPPGDFYRKKTQLWGHFNIPEALWVKPVTHTTKDGKSGSWLWAQLGGKSERTKALRSATPMGFALAFFASNP